MKSGIIRIVDSLGEQVYHTRYHTRLERSIIIEKWEGLYNIRLGCWFIHLIPCIPKKYYKRKKVAKTKTNDMRKLQPYQEDVIKENLNLVTVSELAKKAGVSCRTIYNKKIVSMKRPIYPAYIEDKPKEPVNRPPAAYSNQRLYDKI